MKHYPAEFKADAVALYRSRPGATIKSVAADLGVNTETLRNWIRAADGRRPGAHSAPPATSQAVDDAAQAELAAARKRDPRAGGRTGHSPQGGPVFRDGDALVNRCQFVEDHQRRHGVKRLCTILGLARSSFYYWRGTAAAREARHALWICRATSRTDCPPKLRPARCVGAADPDRRLQRAEPEIEGRGEADLRGFLPVACPVKEQDHIGEEAVAAWQV
ncbi:transposase [Streptomyces lavendulae]|uniref:transposase n=1 Tax=Streptomyces lavendulae TaxID=1914 RepID=UPI00367DF436